MLHVPGCGSLAHGSRFGGQALLSGTTSTALRRCAHLAACMALRSSIWASTGGGAAGGGAAGAGSGAAAGAAGTGSGWISHRASCCVCCAAALPAPTLPCAVCTRHSTTCCIWLAKRADIAPGAARLDLPARACKAAGKGTHRGGRAVSSGESLQGHVAQQACTSYSGMVRVRTCASRQGTRSATHDSLRESQRWRAHQWSLSSCRAAAWQGS